MSILSKKIQTSAGDKDTDFNKVSLLLHGDGTNGAQNNTVIDNSFPGGYAVYLDGTGDYLSVPSNSAFVLGTGDFTIEAWLYLPDVSGTARTIVRTRSNATTTWNLQLNSGYMYFYYGSLSINDATLCPTNTWVHYAAVRSSGVITLYKNGSAVASVTSSFNFTANDTVLIGIGGDSSDANYPTIGYISNLRIVKGTGVYTSNFTPSYVSLPAVANTSLLTCQSSTIIDNSPNNFTITKYGDTVVRTSLYTVTRYGNTTQGSYSPFSQAEGSWSNYFGPSTFSYFRNVGGGIVNFGTSDFTIEGWFYLPVVGINIIIRDDQNSWGVNGISVATYQSKLTIAWGGSYWTGTTVLNPNTWYHFAVVRSGSNLNGYLNGISEISVTAISNTLTNNTYVGGWPNNTSNLYLSNIRIVKGTALYTNNFTPPTTPLTAISGTSLLTCQSNRFKDNSSNNFGLTVNGDVSVSPFSPFNPTTEYSNVSNGGSIYFDGTGDYLTVSSDVNLQLAASNFTIDFWYNPDTLPTTNVSQVIVQKGKVTTSDLEYQVAVENVAGVINITARISTVGSDAQAISFPVNVLNKCWNHIAITRSGTTANLWFNGTNMYSSPGVPTFYSGTGSLAIGGNNAGLTLSNGYISNFRIVKGTTLYSGTTYTVPTIPLTTANTPSILLLGTNSGIYDNSRKNNIETLGNAQISTSVKKYGTGSMYFDGTGDYLNLPSSQELIMGTGDFTIEMWVYATTVTGNYYLANLGTETTGRYQLIITNGSLTTNYYGNVSVTMGGTITINTWTHIAVSRSGSTISGFINGNLLGTTETNSSSIGNGPLKIGSDSAGNNNFNGYIDDLRITKGVARYTSSFTPPIKAYPNQ